MWGNWQRFEVSVILTNIRTFQTSWSANAPMGHLVPIPPVLLMETTPNFQDMWKPKFHLHIYKIDPVDPTLTRIELITGNNHMMFRWIHDGMYFYIRSWKSQGGYLYPELRSHNVNLTTGFSKPLITNNIWPTLPITYSGVARGRTRGGGAREAMRPLLTLHTYQKLHLYAFCNFPP